MCCAGRKGPRTPSRTIDANIEMGIARPFRTPLLGTIKSMVDNNPLFLYLPGCDRPRGQRVREERWRQHLDVGICRSLLTPSSSSLSISHQSHNLPHSPCKHTSSVHLINIHKQTRPRSSTEREGTAKKYVWGHTFPVRGCV